MSAGELNDILDEYVRVPGPLLLVLHAVQRRLGFIPEDAVPVIAERLNFSRAEVHGVVSFYHHFRRSAPGRHAELARLHTLQPLNQKTGSVHAAAWALPGKGIQVVREDVGRHNALDKVIGALTRAGTDLSTGYLIITSRASYEMVQKAATVGVSLIVAVSAPTALAIDLAVKANVTLVGFARADRHVVYAHPQRLQD